MDLSEAKALVDDALTPEEVAAWYREQRRSKAVELLGHISNVENLEKVVADPPNAQAKAEAERLLQDSLAVVDQLTTVVTAHAEREAEALAAIDEAKK